MEHTQRFVDALEQRDLDTAIALLDPEVTWTTRMAADGSQTPGVLTGREQVAARLRELGSWFDKISFLDQRLSIVATAPPRSDDNAHATDADRGTVTGRSPSVYDAGGAGDISGKARSASLAGSPGASPGGRASSGSTSTDHSDSDSDSASSVSPADNADGGSALTGGGSASTFVQTNGDFQTRDGRSYRNVYVFRFDWQNGKMAAWEEYANPVTIRHLEQGQ